MDESVRLFARQRLEIGVGLVEILSRACQVGHCLRVDFRAKARQNLSPQAVSRKERGRIALVLHMRLMKPREISLYLPPGDREQRAHNAPPSRRNPGSAFQAAPAGQL